MSSARRTLVPVLAAGALLVLAVVQARGQEQVSDPNDARGRLDIRSVTVTGGARPVWKVDTYSSWSAASIRDQGQVLVQLDSRGDTSVDYYALVISDGNRLQGSLWRNARPAGGSPPSCRSERECLRNPAFGSRSPSGDVLASRLRITRRGSRSVLIAIPLSKVVIAPERTAVAWYVQTLWTGGKCRRTCFDFAPGRTRAALPVPGPTPATPLVTTPAASPPEDGLPEPSPTETSTAPPEDAPLLPDPGIAGAP